VDTSQYGPDNFLVFSKLSVPLYFISGNHEYLHQYPRLIKLLEAYPKINILDNEKVSYKELEIIGIDYKGETKEGKGGSILSEALKDISLNSQHYSILLYHEPKDIAI